MDTVTKLRELLGRALDERSGFFDARHEAAFRLFNGFTEGLPELVVDLYGRTLVIHDYSEVVEKPGIVDSLEGPEGEAEGRTTVALAREFYGERLPWIEAILLKSRSGRSIEERNGVWLIGESPDRAIREHGVRYAIDLRTNLDAGLYLDTKNLREWLKKSMSGRRVLNTFAYTGSLGIAARAGGAARVVHLDLKKEYLNVAKTSCTLNGFPISKSDFVAGDFWPTISRLIHEKALFDCVILDPPFFSVTSKGVVDAEKNYARLVNKVRPLIAHGGQLIAINNSLYLSGTEYMALLEGLCGDGYLEIEESVPVGEDFTGFATTRVANGAVADPHPFNHSTKIAILRVKRKDHL